MARARARCSDCQQFHRDRCQLDLPECTGPDSIAADECCCFLPDSGVPSFDYRSIHALNKAADRFKKRQNNRAKLNRKCHRAYKRLIRERIKLQRQKEKLEKQARAGKQLALL